LIRQSVSCDICGTEKKQTNHWFVAHELAGELRLSGWSSRHRTRAGAKHLCGQTCLHKLVDDFMARTLSPRTAVPSMESPEGAASAVNDISLTLDAAHAYSESSARLLPPAISALPKQSPGAGIAVLAPAPPPLAVDSAVTAPADEPPAYASRSWRSEAWERERERELRFGDRQTEPRARRRPAAR
jgi:hypothetical protein